MAGKSKKATASRTARKIAPAARKASRPTRSPESVKKPVFRLGTWIAILVLLALVIFAYYFNKQKEAVGTEPTPTEGVTYLFKAEDGSPSSIEIAPSEGETVKVERRADGVWKLSLPFEAAANQGSAQAAADQVTTLRILDEVDAALDILGLDQPTFVITIGFTSGKSHTLEIGDSTPTTSGYYSRVDGKQTVILSKDGIDALLNLQASPPYLETPTPSLLPPTETPVPIIDATPSPAP